jgi:hypothetical protein
MYRKSFNDIIKFPSNCDKQKYLLDKCKIDYKSFYECAKNNDKYKELTNEDSIIKFLINLQ